VNYPTIEEIEKADREQLCRWHRFLHSPGWDAIGQENFKEVMDREKVILDHIEIRLLRFGGFTPEISKKIGWRE
jgi:ssRNA-specific RNase YbeY (16S rRNA maturation enzyme)